MVSLFGFYNIFHCVTNPPHAVAIPFKNKGEAFQRSIRLSNENRFQNHSVLKTPFKEPPGLRLSGSAPPGEGVCVCVCVGGCRSGSEPGQRHSHPAQEVFAIRPRRVVHVLQVIPVSIPLFSSISSISSLSSSSSSSSALLQLPGLGACLDGGLGTDTGPPLPRLLDPVAAELGEDHLRVRPAPLQHLSITHSARRQARRIIRSEIPEIASDYVIGFGFT